jgi:hypothetical protein
MLIQGLDFVNNTQIFLLLRYIMAATWVDHPVGQQCVLLCGCNSVSPPEETTLSK